jgi:hypothetical protein
MARPFPTNNAVTNAVAANTPIALCMTEIPCQSDPAACGVVRCLDVRIATNIAAHRSTSRRLRLAFPAIKQDVRRRLRDQLGEATVES